MANVYEQLKSGQMKTNYTVTDKMARDLQAAADKAAAANNASSQADHNTNPVTYNTSSSSSYGTASNYPSTTTYGTTNNNDLIAQQYSQSLAAKASALQKARDTAVNQYNGQINELPNQYQPLRNQASLTGEQNSRAINEQMAAQGNWRSGANQTAQTANSASTANNIASSNLAQQQAVDKLKQAIAQANVDYETGVAGATADTEAQRIAALINQLNADRNYQLQQQQLANSQTNSDRSYQLQQQQFEHGVSQDTFNNGINAAQVTGYTPNIISSLYPAWNVPAKTYGLQADVNANPGINLYIPGQTQLQQGDIFLGGAGTGVTDAQLNGAQRIAGNTANDTAALYKNYLNSVGAGQANSLPSYIAQQYPGATDVTNNNGTYKFKDAAGNTVYYRG
jgi:hypothetical protein